MLRLEYEAYAPMALSKLREICATMRERWGVHKAAPVQRFLTVPTHRYWWVPFLPPPPTTTTTCGLSI